MTRLGIGLWFAATLLVSMFSASKLHGQAATASVSGTITDASGAAVPAAVISVKNTGTALARTIMSDAQGRYLVPDLGIGDYEIQATKAGFQTVIRKGITLDVGSAPVIDFQLPVGRSEQTVNVESQISQVETTTSAVSSPGEPNSNPRVTLKRP